jgi:hypothetical protein
VQASRPFKPAQASQPVCPIQCIDDVVTVSLSDTEEALELLSLGLDCVISSRPSVNDARRLSSSLSAGSEWFEDWPMVNDEPTSVYIASTTEPSSSQQVQVETSDRSRGQSRALAPKVESTLVHRGASERSSHARSSMTQRPCSEMV